MSNSDHSGNIHDGQAERRRLYVPTLLAQDLVVRLPEEASHYLIRVLRMREGAHVTLFNSQDGAWDGVIVAAHKAHAEVKIIRHLRPPEPQADIWVMAAPLKKHRFEIVVEKITELGAARLLPVITRHSDVRDVRMDRMLAIATEAAEQCESLSLPDIQPLQTLEKCLGSWPKERALLLCCERGDAKPIEHIVPDYAGTPMGIAIGPAGGFHDDEIALMTSLPFVLPVSMGRRILRADTAAIAALSVCMAASGFWAGQRGSAK